MPRSIATSAAVDLAELLDFIRPRRRMTLVTRRRDGSPQLSPVTGGADDEYRQAMTDQDKSLIRIIPTRWGPIATGGVPARLAN